MRNLSKPLPIFLALLAGSAFWAFADQISALQSLLKAENDFAAMSLDKGMRAAFLANLADNGVLFDPGPVNGQKLWEKREPSEAQLSWKPVFADIALAGDIGYTTGPWEYRKKAGDAKPVAYGHFLSIWRKPEGGDWKLLVDSGIDTPAPLGKSIPGAEPKGDEPADATTNLKASRLSLAEAEKEFDADAKKDYSAALIANAANDVRIFRNDRFPAVGRDAARLMLGYDHGHMTVKKTDGGISRSGELGFAYGTYASERGDNTEKGSYITIWKRNFAGDWRLVVDLRKVFPPEKPKD